MPLCVLKKRPSYWFCGFCSLQQDQVSSLHFAMAYLRYSTCIQRISSQCIEKCPRLQKLSSEHCCSFPLAAFVVSMQGALPFTVISGHFVATSTHNLLTATISFLLNSRFLPSKAKSIEDYFVVWQNPGWMALHMKTFLRSKTNFGVL